MEDSYNLLCRKSGPVNDKDFGNIVRFPVNEETRKNNAIIQPGQTEAEEKVATNSDESDKLSGQKFQLKNARHYSFSGRL